MKKKTLTILIVVLGLTLCSAKAEPMGTAFTYQGQLYDSNYPANGEYDFQFKLYDAAEDGNQIGDDVNVAGKDVVDGYFTVLLDFNNSNTFNGNECLLEISIRPGELEDPNEYTTLEPRQKVTPTPHAIYANSSNWNNLIDIPADINDGDDVGSGVPSGGIIMWSGSTANIPSGWALCNGSNGTPDLRDRFIVGAGNSYHVNDIGGESFHTLTIDEMPAHHHTYQRHVRHCHFSGNDVCSVKDNLETHNTGDAGGSQPHENRPPYFALAYIMKL